RADEKRTAFLELLHVLLSAQIKIGHATVWMRIRVCVSFILRPSLLPFGFAPWFAPILRRGIHWIADAHRSDERRFIVRVNEKLTAFMEPRSRPSAGRPRGDFCPSWSGQAAARLNCRAATPNAIRVSVINDRVDPVSGTPATVGHTPGWSWVCPNAPPTVTRSLSFGSPPL